CFFRCAPHHRYLHSFPTRRSSDLQGEIGWVLDPAHGGQGFASEAVRAVLALGFDHYRLHRITAQMDARNSASAALARRVGLRLRSEEHTSELQSRENLVCRLLLEK